jgi:hypothetical protein
MKRKTNPRFNRKYATRDEFKRIYIFTEGKKTEVNYLTSKKEEVAKEIRKRNIEIVIHGTGRNTLSLVDYALDYLSINKITVNNSTQSDECWVVFDKDDFIKNFNSAIKKAEKENLKIAYSNECFELWFLLHFNFTDAAMHRTDYKNKLDEKISRINGQNYHKNSETMYTLIQHLEKDAIRNAKKLLKIHQGERSFSKKNPSTTVHLLVESLNELKK